MSRSGSWTRLIRDAAARPIPFRELSYEARARIADNVFLSIINAVRSLGIEFVLDVAPASRKPALVTARAQKHGAIRHDYVSVVAVSSV